MDENKNPVKRWMPSWLSLPFICIIAFLIYTLFVHENSYIQSFKYGQTINELKSEIEQNLDSASYYREKAQKLDTDRESLEKIAREQYYMKNVNEDIYITNIK